MGLQQTDEAIAQYETVLEQSPKYLPAMMTLAILHEHKGDLEQAEAYYRKILKVNDEFAPAANNLAYLLLRSGGNVDEALSFAQTAKRINPDDPGISDTLGWIYVQKKAYASAIAQLEDAAEKLPDNPTVLYHLGTAYAKNDNLEQARTHLQAALDLDRPFAEEDQARELLQEIGEK